MWADDPSACVCSVDDKIWSESTLRELIVKLAWIVKYGIQINSDNSPHNRVEGNIWIVERKQLLFSRENFSLVPADIKRIDAMDLCYK